MQPGIKIKLAFGHQLRLERNAHPVERAAVTEQAIIGSHVIGVALDKADPAVTGIDQMRRHVVGGLGIVHEHG